MFYSKTEPTNSLIGLKQLIDEIIYPNFVMAEIGCFAGISSELFAKHCQLLYCIDIWNLQDENYKERADIHIERAYKSFCKMAEDYPNITTMEAFSMDASTLFPDKSLDLVYVDANHMKPKVKEDIIAWWPKVKQGGWITGHDMWYEGIREAVEELLGTNYKTYPDSSWAIRKLPGMYLKS
jgi:predicted O-methyltransferase YrrM